MKFQILNLDIDSVVENNGQIDGVPPNPRIISNPEFERLKKSISNNREMLSLREVICVKVDDKYVAICGNMRLRALKSLGDKEIVCKVIEDASPKQMRAYLLKDNIQFGTDDLESIAENWDASELDEFGFSDFLNDNKVVDEFIEEGKVVDETTVRFRVKKTMEEEIHRRLKEINKNETNAFLSLLGFEIKEEEKKEENGN